MNQSAQAFYAAREFLLTHREDYDTAYRDFRWPVISEFNWALDPFDAAGHGGVDLSGIIQHVRSLAGK
jgi:acetyl-CoA synthetase